jgi:VWFA-related protein
MMKANSMSYTRSLTLAVALCLISLSAYGQEQTRKPEESADEVVRIETELVQTSVMVFDKRGRFVDGLKPEQFELRVDDKIVPVSFFERVVAGSAAEEAQLRALNAGRVEAGSAPGKTSSRGRTVIFFIDDLHLSLDSLTRTRTAISNFIEREMNQSDLVAISSASGQIGFLQQLTDNKAVLRAALARLKYVPYSVRDTEQPAMSEYMALKIEQRDRDALGYYVQRCLHDNPRYTPTKCLEVVSDRARVVIQQASAVTSNTLYSLESLMRSSGQSKGRKLVLLISDGFFLGALSRYGNVFDKLPQITDEARRHGVVIYTIDARGLISGQADATANLVDGNGLLDRANLGEIPASQDALHALAADTGGRALRNSNSISDWVNDSLKETSNYYLLAWRPASSEQRTNKFKRISIKITDRPELTVRLPRGYLDSVQQAPAVAATDKSKPPSQQETIAKALPPALADLRAALGASSTQHALSILLSATFLDTPKNGTVLTASTQIATDNLSYGTDNRQAASIDLAGVILNTDGKPSASFSTHLNVNPLPSNQTNTDDGGVIYNYRAPLAPGLYQVRVAARDERSGRTGSSMQWIEIPDLKSRALSLSSLLTGVQEVSETQKVRETQSNASQTQFSVNQRFKRSSRLGFLVFIYNARAAAEGGATDLTGQVQVFDAGGRAVIETPARALTSVGVTDTARIPYAGAFPLSALAPNRYVLRITVTDRITKTSATQQVKFTVE